MVCSMTQIPTYILILNAWDVSGTYNTSIKIIAKSEVGMAVYTKKQTNKSSRDNQYSTYIPMLAI